MTRPAHPAARLLRLIAVTLAIALLAGPLVACGKNGPPENPKEEKVPFPRTYPR